MQRQKWNDGQLQIVRCRVGEESFAIDLEQVRGFHRADRLDWETEGHAARLPTEAGDVPVFPLGRLLDRPEGDLRAASHVVLLKTEQGAWGLLADGVSRVMRLEVGTRRPLPPLLRHWPQIPARSVLLGDQQPHLLLNAAMLHPSAVPAPPASDQEPAEQDDQDADSADVKGRILLFPLIQAQTGERPLSAGLGIAFVKEILELPPLTRVPRTPSFVLGLTNWRSRPLPVIDLAARLGLAALRLDRHCRMVVIRGGEMGLVGLAVPQGIRVLPLPLEHTPCRRHLPLDSSAIHGAVELGRDTMIVPNLARILGQPLMSEPVA